ncbi:hypothetical protein [Parvicella tangerina]|uniref:Uncharacterized protein n=1 Tax=Parvicella tangerina TaxID=2829795 RepID=A0A916JP98_9FLAO|nr:hypothetical protein [Parvicella tangerina]CAG5085416.1 hypothetical protein CRYO30217_02753 [Parvicella tangerina]
MIQFPCPKKKEDFIESNQGVYCSDCNTTLLDLSKSTLHEIEESRKNNPGACVVLEESMAEVETYGLKRFALALIIVMGRAGLLLETNSWRLI